MHRTVSLRDTVCLPCAAASFLAALRNAAALHVPSIATHPLLFRLTDVSTPPCRLQLLLCLTHTLLCSAVCPNPQLVALLPIEAVTCAAAAVLLPQPLTFQGLLGLKLYRTAVAQLVKSSGTEPGAPQVREVPAGFTNTFKHAMLEQSPAGPWQGKGALATVQYA